MNDESEKNNRDKALVAATKRDEQPIELALTTPHKPFIDSGDTTYMMKDVSVITGKPILSHIGTGKARKDKTKATA